MYLQYPLYMALFVVARGIISQSKLNVTAIGTYNKTSRFECWQLEDSEFTAAVVKGTTGTAIASLGEVDRLSVSIGPAGLHGGFHVAPQPQWVVITSGVALLAVPDEDQYPEYLFSAGSEFGLLFAADTAGVSRLGHDSWYITDVAFLQIPTKNGEIPRHKTLHMGSCQANETVGLTEPIDSEDIT